MNLLKYYAQKMYTTPSLLRVTQCLTLLLHPNRFKASLFVSSQFQSSANPLVKIRVISRIFCLGFHLQKDVFMVVTKKIKTIKNLFVFIFFNFYKSGKDFIGESKALSPPTYGLVYDSLPSCSGTISSSIPIDSKLPSLYHPNFNPVQIH